MNRQFEKILVEQCAPTLAGVKPANLFRFTPEGQNDVHAAVFYWNEQLNSKGVCIRLLKECGKTNSYLILAYREVWIAKILSQKETQDFFKQHGYLVPDHCDALIKQLSARFCRDEEFPHEVGILLGYPLCDVIEFIQNKGENYSCSGCWKVYGDPIAAKQYFNVLKKCTAVYKRKYDKGTPLLQLTMPVCHPVTEKSRNLLRHH